MLHLLHKLLRASSGHVAEVVANGLVHPGLRKQVCVSLLVGRDGRVAEHHLVLASSKRKKKFFSRCTFWSRACASNHAWIK